MSLRTKADCWQVVGGVGLSFPGDLEGFSRWRQYSVVVMRQALESGDIRTVTQAFKTQFPHP